MSIMIIILGIVLVGISFIQTILDMPFSQYLLGNLKITGLLLEILIMVNILLFSGTISSLVINAGAGILAIMLLKLAAAWSTTKKIVRDPDNPESFFGFTTITVPPSMDFPKLLEYFKEVSVYTFQSIYALFTGAKGVSNV